MGLETVTNSRVLFQLKLMNLSRSAQFWYRWSTATVIGRGIQQVNVDKPVIITAAVQPILASLLEAD